MICLSHVCVLHNLHILAFSRRSASCHNDKVLRHVDMQLLMMITEPSSCWTVHSPFVSKRPCWRLASECACSHPSMWFWVVTSFLNVCKSKLWSNCYMFYSWWLNHTYGIRLECCCTGLACYFDHRLSNWVHFKAPLLLILWRLGLAEGGLGTNLCKSRPWHYGKCQEYRETMVIVIAPNR